MQIVNNDNEFLNIEQVSIFLGVPKSTIYAMTMRKTIPHFKLGRLVRFRKADLIAYMETLRIDSRSMNNG